MVLSARNLPPRPAAIKALSLRDSYCNVSFAGARQVTPVIRQSQSPTWNYSALFPLDTNREDDDPGRGPPPAAGAPSVSAPGGDNGAKPDDDIRSLNGVAKPPAETKAATPKLRPPPMLLRIDMKDVDPLPPDDDLG